MRPRILVSACLAGECVRYDGRAKPHARVLAWLRQGRAVPFCPEVAGGLSVPRPRAEIQGGDGADVLAGHARVVTEHGEDCTVPFLRGAQAALALCRREGLAIAVLKEGSPSCGVRCIADGSFTGCKRAGMGVTAALLAQAGLRLFSEHDLGPC